MLKLYYLCLSFLLVGTPCASDSPTDPSAQQQQNLEEPIPFNEEHVSLFGAEAVAQGYDVVAYFSGQAVPGKRDYQTEYRGGSFRFSSRKNLQTFLADPEKYLPQYGSFCAYAIAKGYLAPIDPRAYTIVAGKLYLNYNFKVQEKWRKNRDHFIKEADSNWPEVREKTREFNQIPTPGGIFY